MGLDSYWYHDDWTDEDGTVDPDAVPAPDADLSLTGGMLSAHGAGSFRGKVYDACIEHITGESLYQHAIENETVTAMAADLEDALERAQVANDWEEAIGEFWSDTPTRSTARDWYGPNSLDEFEDLVTMFRFYADEGAELHGWW